MKAFLAYFDILGFKNIVENNDIIKLEKIMGNLFLTTQMAISDEKLREENGRIFPDLSNQNVHCINVSDSIIFWTNDCSTTSFKSIVEACSNFYITTLQRSFALRGCLVLRDFIFKPMSRTNDKNAILINSSIYGRALVDAYTKSDALELSGCFIDKSAVEEMPLEVIENLLRDQVICRYNLPFKREKQSLEYTFTPFKGESSEEYLFSKSQQVHRCFTHYQRSTDLDPRVLAKRDNTLRFISSFNSSSN